MSPFNFTPDPRFNADPNTIADPRFNPTQPVITPTLPLPNFVISSNFSLLRGYGRNLVLFGDNHE